MTIAEVPVGSINMYRLFLLPRIGCVCREGRQCSKVVGTTKEELKENMRTMLGDISPHLHLVKKYHRLMRTMCYVLQVTISDNMTVTAVHEKPMDLQRIPKDIDFVL